MHYLDANKTAGEEARRQLHKNVASNTEQVLAATPNKVPTIRPPAITKTVQVWRTRPAGHSWRSRDEFITDVLLWNPSYGQVKAGRHARTYIQQLCEDTGCSPDDTPKAMNDWEKWRESVRDIHASGTTWWWWWWYIHIYICISSRMSPWFLLLRNHRKNYDIYFAPEYKIKPKTFLFECVLNIVWHLNTCKFIQIVGCGGTGENDLLFLVVRKVYVLLRIHICLLYPQRLF